MGLGNNILKIRTSKNLTQEQFAEMLSVSRQSVSKWELDQALPETDKVLLISKLFSVSTDEILLGNTKPSKVADDFLPVADCTECQSVSLEKEYTEVLSGVDIHTSLCNIYFHNSDNGKAKVVICSEPERYAANIEQGVLKIAIADNQSSQQNVSRIEIYLPAEFENEIKVDNKCGNVTFDNAKLIDVNVNQGTVKVVDKVDTANISCNLGNIEIGIVENEMQLSNSCGNIAIGYVSLKKDSSARTALGNISIGGNENAKIEAFASLGEVTTNNKYLNSDITLSLSTNTGNISVG